MKKVISLMEEKARQFPLLSKKPALSKLPSPEETKEEISSLCEILSLLSKELQEAREVVSRKEKQFSLLAIYKYLLQGTLITPTIYTLKTPPTPKRDKAQELIEEIESLTPQQREFLKTVEID